ncbi:dTDP-glucose 4,6-dehydratase [Thalassoglobus neptunius]|uniref:dTDP-glucose 4,6-dehydratase n=1 Tax=Thalassoglobus neptunius TaxID=1938619 RepID=A0A5C5X789_9PLAN|nr:NAD-dependent epimerase [Thalassoglobus neptunius]TWT58211.1 dTDP-glucose 4,6-dehydratase [Thalassoglobus neptunius]
MKILVTGTAGFIGFHTARTLLGRGDEVVGVDCVNDYYSVELKETRLEMLNSDERFQFHRFDLSDRVKNAEFFQAQQFDGVIHLAAQAGVRYSLTNPHAYISSNIDGFLNILEGCRHSKVKHLVYASSSSVYGANTTMPFAVTDNVDHPVSLYAASKKANELMAHSYSHLYQMPTTGLRFFTVYGPWGRPDMALFLFTKAILADKPIDVFNEGKMQRDFTYIDDIVDGIIRVLDRPAEPNPQWSGDSPDPSTSKAPYRIFNIGNHRPVELLEMIQSLERCLGKKAKMNLLPMQPGDVPATFADIESIREVTGFAPKTSLDSGIEQFVKWYRDYYQV